jgi:2C-methyl-D-erythritol 2,4-cyclodiphosphate synthase
MCIVVLLDRERLSKVVMARAKALLATSLYQRIGKRHEDARNNRWKGLSLKKTLEEELTDAQTRCNTILQMINRMMNELPSLEPKMEILAIQIDLVLRAPRLC